MTPAVRLRAADLGWLAVVLGAVVFGALALVLGPGIGDRLQVLPEDLFDDLYIGFLVKPEPTESGRALIVLAAPIVIALAIVALADRRWPSSVEKLAAPAAIAGQVVIVAVTAIGLLHRDVDFFDADLASFTTAALVAAALVVVAAVALAGSSRVQSALARLDEASSRPPCAWVLVAAVVLLTAIWLLPAVFFDRDFVEATQYIWDHLQVTFEDFSAVANGATPSVDYASQYSNLLAYVLSPVFAVIGLTPGHFTLAATGLSLGALVAVFGALRITTGSLIAATALYLPVLALSLLPQLGGGAVRTYNADVYQLLPLRYVGPFVLAWLLARRLAGLRVGPPALLFLLAGLALFNNPEFGTPALIGLVVAVGLAELSREAADRRLGALAAQITLGLALSVVVVCVLTLVRAGELPDPGLWLLFSRLFARTSFGLIPLPDVGLYWAVYMTFAAAIVTAGVRAAAHDPDRTLTGMLAFAGVFGLGAGVYYAGRSAPENLLGIYPSWGFALAVLVWLVVRRLAGAASWRTVLARCGPLGIAVLFGFALMATTLPTIPAPWSQVDRLATASPGRSPMDVTDAVAFVERETEPDEKVALIASNGHYIAEEAGVDNVSPLNTPQHVITEEILDLILDRLEQSGGRTLFTPIPEARPVPATPGSQFPLYTGIPAALEARGWSEISVDGRSELALWRRSGG